MVIKKVGPLREILGSKEVQKGVNRREVVPSTALFGGPSCSSVTILRFWYLVLDPILGSLVQKKSEKQLLNDIVGDKQNTCFKHGDGETPTQLISR